MIEQIIVVSGAVVLLACATYLFASYLGIQRQLRELEDKNEQD